VDGNQTWRREVFPTGEVSQINLVTEYGLNLGQYFSNTAEVSTLAFDLVSGSNIAEVIVNALKLWFALIFVP
jgi:hypothetical protein